MNRIPHITGPKEGHDFHDSSLIEFSVNAHLDAISVVVSTPDKNQIARVWRIDCEGVLRLDYESLGTGSGSHRTPLEIYEIYNDIDSNERQRWTERLTLLGVPPAEAKNVVHLVLASSFAAGWGEREDMEGISIVCRKVSVTSADTSYDHFAYSRPRIEAGDE